MERRGERGGVGGVLEELRKPSFNDPAFHKEVKTSDYFRLNLQTAYLFVFHSIFFIKVFTCI